MIGDSACIIGLGLIGGSIARDLAGLGLRIAGYDADPGTLTAAHDAGIVATRLGRDLRDALSHDLVILATPVAQMPGILRQLAQQTGSARLITDVGSTKQTILDTAEAAGLGARFVGSHPLTGDQRSGWNAGRSGLFQGSTVFLCPTRVTTPRSVSLATHLWERIGASVRVMPAAEHDTRVAWISHLPQALASALAIVLGDQGFAQGDLGPGGRDMTRLAASDARMWTDILIANRNALDEPLMETAKQLGRLRDALCVEDEEAILEFLRGGAAFGD